MEPDLVLNLADPGVHRRYLAHPELLLEVLGAASAATRVVLIDEVQKVPALPCPRDDAAPNRLTASAARGTGWVAEGAPGTYAAAMTTPTRAGRWRAAALLTALIGLAPLPAAAAMLKAGDAFPDWQLTDHTGATVSSRDLAGKRYLIWFYPKAMTPGCTAEGQGLRDRFAAFQAQRVEIVGVSFDAPKDNAEFVAAEGFPFKLLSDTDRVLASQVGAADSPAQTSARRISYLVGADSKVLVAYATVAPAAHSQAVLDDLAAQP